jgi:CubicO group peptidase (beta-lactamase class C family)
MNSICVLTFTTLFSVLSGCGIAQNCRTNSSPLVQTETIIIEKLANELQQEHLSGTFDGLITISQGKTTLFKQAYGCADRKNKIKNTSTTISDIGSIAKTFTAASILQLVANNKLKLTDTIGYFYPNASEVTASITITQLLTHSSGLDNFHNNSDFELMDKDEAVRRILAMPLIFKAEEEIAYSNAAYTLLASIVEQVSGQRFKNYIRENLIDPFELSNTGFYGDEHINTNRLALGYGGKRPGTTTFERDLTWALMGAGGMVSSIDDLVSWFSVLSNGKIFPENSPNNIFKAANERWLLGSFSQFEFLETSVIQMGGSTDYGYTALIQFVAEHDLLVVLLLNGHDRKYKNATHHKLSRNHILPILLSKNE